MFVNRSTHFDRDFPQLFPPKKSVFRLRFDLTNREAVCYTVSAEQAGSQTPEPGLPETVENHGTVYPAVFFYFREGHP